MIKSNCSPILTTLGRQYKSDLDCDNRSMVQGEFDLALHFQFLLKQLCKFKVEKYCNIQSFPSHHSLRFFGLVLVSSPDLWAPTAASYCPSRAGELPKQNMTKSHERWDGKLCILPSQSHLQMVLCDSAPTPGSLRFASALPTSHCVTPSLILRCLNRSANASNSLEST